MGKDRSRVVVINDDKPANDNAGLFDRKKSARPTETTVTVITSEPLSGESANEWLGQMEQSQDQSWEIALDGLTVLNGLLYAFRVASLSPYVNELEIESAMAVRIGTSAGEEAWLGDPANSFQLEKTEKEPKRKRRAMLDPISRTIELVTGKDELLVFEELVIRARHDLTMGRLRHAALQADLALESLLVELERASLSESQREKLPSYTEPLRQAEKQLEELADRALEDELQEDGETTDFLERVTSQMERVLRLRHYG